MKTGPSDVSTMRRALPGCSDHYRAITVASPRGVVADRFHLLAGHGGKDALRGFGAAIVLAHPEHAEPHPYLEQRLSLYPLLYQAGASQIRCPSFR